MVESLQQLCIKQVSQSPQDVERLKAFYIGRDLVLYMEEEAIRAHHRLVNTRDRLSRVEDLYRSDMVIENCASEMWMCSQALWDHDIPLTETDWFSYFTTFRTLAFVDSPTLVMIDVAFWVSWIRGISTSLEMLEVPCGPISQEYLGILDATSGYSRALSRLAHNAGVHPRKVQETVRELTDRLKEDRSRLTTAQQCFRRISGLGLA